MNVNNSFPVEFEVEVWPGPPADEGRTWYFPGGRRWSPYGELSVRFRPALGPEWVGVFSECGSFGGYARGAWLGPSRTGALVVAGGHGYIVDVRGPELTREVDVMPITDVVVDAERGALVVIAVDRACAIGEEGVRWTTRVFAHDGVVVAGVASGRLRGLATMPGLRPSSEFSIDLSTGEVTGGLTGYS